MTPEESAVTWTRPVLGSVIVWSIVRQGLSAVVGIDPLLCFRARRTSRFASRGTRGLPVGRTRACRGGELGEQAAVAVELHHVARAIGRSYGDHVLAFGVRSCRRPQLGTAPFEEAGLLVEDEVSALGAAVLRHFYVVVGVERPVVRGEGSEDRARCTRPASPSPGCSAPRSCGSDRPEVGALLDDAEVPRPSKQALRVSTMSVAGVPCSWSSSW